MGRTEKAIHEINYMDTLASRDNYINNIHPLVKIMLSVLYIVTVISCNKYDIASTAGMVVYPFAVFILSEVPFIESIKKLRLVLPLVLLMVIFNPLYDRIPVIIYGIHTTSGVLSMVTLIMKGIFAILSSYLLIATTKIEHICYALRMVHIPKIIVTQLLLLYRYLPLLLTEAGRVTQAYSLRAPGQKGIHFKVWGSLTGQILLRSMDRAGRVYESMLLRGYNGEFTYTVIHVKICYKDIIYLVIWTMVIILFRKVPVFYLAGSLL